MSIDIKFAKITFPVGIISCIEIIKISGFKCDCQLFWDWQWWNSTGNEILPLNQTILIYGASKILNPKDAEVLEEAGCNILGIEI